MATWQFDLHLLPSRAVTATHGGVPLTIFREDFDKGDWWRDVTITPNIKAQLAKLLRPASSWSPRIEVWGIEDGDRIDVVGESGHVEDILVRVDVRDLSYKFLMEMTKVARENDWLILTQDNHVLRPSVKEVLRAIHRSDSFRFVRDPAAFLEKLARSTGGDLDEG